MFLCKALIGIRVCWSACEDAFIVLTRDSYSAFGFYVWFLWLMLSISVNCARLQIMKVKALSVTSRGGGEVTMNTLSWKLWAVKRKILNINDTVWSEKPLKMAGRQLVQGQACAFKATCTTMVFAFSSSPIFFVHEVLLLRRCSRSVSTWSHCRDVGEKENEKTVKTILFLRAVAISLLWEFHPRGVIPVMKAGHFCHFPCLLRSHEPVTGKWIPEADGRKNLGRGLVNVTSTADLPRSR